MPLDPDPATRIALIGTTERLHSTRTDRDDAIAQVQKIAGGRTDLLAQAAGHFIGSGTWNSEPCARLLIDAGADPALVDDAAEAVRTNLRRMGTYQCRDRWRRKQSVLAARVMTMDELTETDKAMLDFEHLWWKHAGAKDSAIREKFGMPAIRYYQRLGFILEMPAALEYDAPLVNRLARIKGRQRAARTSAAS